jgi:hypothetical protein
MTPELIFTIVNIIAGVSWVALAVLPSRPGVAYATGMAVPAFLASIYVLIVVTTFAGSEGGFASLAAVATLFSNSWLLLAGWTHYLAFDLFVGSWEVRDARDRGISHLLVLPCLVLTFLFGPAGWLLYLVLRARSATAS